MDEIVTESTESSSSSSSSSSKQGKKDHSCRSYSQGFEFLSNTRLMFHWLSKFLGRHGAEQLALAPVQLGADVIRARPFQDTVDFVQQARSRTQQQRRQPWQQESISNPGRRLGGQQRQSREDLVGADEHAEGDELLMPVQRSRAGAWRRKEAAQKSFCIGASGGASGAAAGAGREHSNRDQRRPGKEFSRR